MKAGSLWFGRTWFMQTPLENIGNDFVIIICFQYTADEKENTNVCKYRHIYKINKSKINSDAITFSFADKSKSIIPDA